jgi:hypothetical protein
MQRITIFVCYKSTYMHDILSAWQNNNTKKAVTMHRVLVTAWCIICMLYVVSLCSLYLLPHGCRIIWRKYANIPHIIISNLLLSFISQNLGPYVINTGFRSILFPFYYQPRIIFIIWNFLRVHTYLLTELSPSWETANCAATQELPSTLTLSLLT